MMAQTGLLALFASLIFTAREFAHYATSRAISSQIEAESAARVHGAMLG
jgi:hypothetical protein